eukprot:SAG31_NODE_19971_length_587_cov_0.952869_1_plen_45_part_00
MPVATIDSCAHTAVPAGYGTDIDLNLAGEGPLLFKTDGIEIIKI